MLKAKAFGYARLATMSRLVLDSCLDYFVHVQSVWLSALTMVAALKAAMTGYNQQLALDTISNLHWTQSAICTGHNQQFALETISNAHWIQSASCTEYNQQFGFMNTSLTSLDFDDFIELVVLAMLAMQATLFANL